MPLISVSPMTDFIFKGREFVYNHHHSVPFCPLLPDEGKGVGPAALDGNLVIHGDNLHALKSLIPLYAGLVDCIFIDPPYNTGNEGWCYNDNVSSPMTKEWLEANPVGIEDGLRHDKWCAMMWPRLRMLHELLSEKGTLWLTLDGNEVHRAKLMLDMIFGEEHMIGNLVWEKSDSPRMDTRTFSSSYDFILVYAKNPDQMIFNRLQQEESDVPSHYNKEDEDGRLYYLKPLRMMGGRSETREAAPNLYYALKSPDGDDVFPKMQDGSDGAWRWSKGKFERESGRIEWRKGNGSGSWVPYFRIYADTLSGRPPETIWYHRDVGGSRTAKAQIKQIFSGPEFDTPKPLGLLSRVIEISTEKESIILDSFAGSGTTAHAVLDMNKEDGGNRRFVLVEMEDYADRLTAERVRRVINGYAFKGTQKTELLREKITWSKIRKAEKIIKTVEGLEDLHGREYDKIKKTVKDGELIVTGETVVKDHVEGLGGSFTYCTLGEPVEFDKVLTGESLPPYASLGAALFHMATYSIIDPAQIRESDGYLGRTGLEHVWLIYKPDIEWLQSQEAALTLKRAKEIAATDPEHTHLVIAAARYVSTKVLAEEGLDVEFVPLPYALYRFDRV